MSSESDIIFNIYYGGKFVTHEGGEVTYGGGETHVLEIAAQSLFTGLMSGLKVSLYGQRIWYKAPFEEVKEAKIMCNGSENFQRMCFAAMWTRMIDIYMELDDDRNEGEEAAENDGEATKNEGHDDETGNDIPPVNLGRESQFEEEARIEAIVSQFVDEEENGEYRKTSPVSDSEEEQNACPYERWKEGSGELKISQVFESVKEFKDVVVEYALKGGWNIRFNRWGDVKGGVVCGVDVEEGESPCPWRVYCSYVHSVGMWMVKTFQEEHTCFKDGHCKFLSDNIIAKMFLNDVRNDPSLKPKYFQEQILERYNLNTKNDQCRKAKKKALDIIQAEYDEQYSRIKDYEKGIHE